MPSTFDPESSPPSGYRGHDRRRLVTEAPSPRSRPFVVGGLILLISWLLTGLIAVRLHRSSVNFNLLNVEFATAAAALAAFAGTLCVLYWRLLNDAAALWIGAGLLVFGVATVGLGDVVAGGGVVGGLVAIDTDVLAWLRPASVLVVLGLFTVALRSPEIDMGLDPRKVILLSFGAVTALTLVLELLPTLSAAVTGAADTVPNAADSGWGAGLVALLWVWLATALALRGWKKEHQLLLWMSTVMFGLTAAELSRGLGVLVDPQWATGAALLQATAACIAVIGITSQLRSVFAMQNQRLFQTRTQSLVSEARFRDQLAKEEERSHEARNALSAIEGAVITLEHHRDRLDELSKRALTRALSHEIAHLQRLVSSEQTGPTYRIVFDPNEVIRAQIELARSQGCAFETDLQDDLLGYGRPANVAEALQNVLVNARIHAEGSAVLVTARREDGWVVIRVRDDGPGIDPDHRERIFTRGGRASPAPGSGLGLYVSRQLMHEQGGDLRLEETHDGGASFVLTVAAAPQARSASGVGDGRPDLAHHPADGPYVLDEDVTLAETGTDSPDAGAGGRLGQAHQDPHGNPGG